MADFSVELKYIQLAGIKVKATSSATVNISCPVCGEGKSKWKARGYVLKKQGDDSAAYFCQNECGAMSFYDMLMNVNPTLASGYVSETKKQKLRNFRKQDLDAFDLTPSTITEKPIPDVIVIDSQVYSLNALNQSALDYLLNVRKLPENTLKHFRYIKDLDAICALFLTNDNKFYGYQLRYIQDKQFHIHLFDNNPKIWGLFSVDTSKPVYVFESIFDALSSGLENVIAMLGADISKTLIEQWFPDVQMIFCLDNDTAGKAKAIKYSSLGYKVLVHRPEFPVKDFNAALVAGATVKQIAAYIQANVLSAKLANMKLRIAP